MPKPIHNKKQLSIFVPMSDWKAIRLEAAKQKIPMTELCRRWLRPEISRVKNYSTELVD